MSSLKVILWIDDEKERVHDKNIFEENLGVVVNFVDVSGKSLIEELKTIKKTQQEPSLVLVDHYLTHTIVDGEESRLISFGSSAAEILREAWPECPIVSITNEPEKIDRHKKDIYEEIIPYSEKSDYLPLITSIMDGFAFLKENRPKDVNDFLGLLCPPEDDREQIISVIPNHLKSNFDETGLCPNIYRWVMHSLIERPGFLYDDLWVSTLLGLKPESFQKVRDRFQEAKYEGIFSNNKRERWWRSEIKRILFTAMPDDPEILPWRLGSSLPGLSSEDMSTCYRDDCKDTEPPEVVAYTDESSPHREQMHRKCTTTHPQFERSIYFEEIRIMGKE